MRKFTPMLICHVFEACRRHIYAHIREAVRGAAPRQELMAQQFLPSLQRNSAARHVFRGFCSADDI